MDELHPTPRRRTREWLPASTLARRRAREPLTRWLRVLAAVLLTLAFMGGLALLLRQTAAR